MQAVIELFFYGVIWGVGTTIPLSILFYGINQAIKMVKKGG